MAANDRQVGGDHYKSRVQHWDFAFANCGRGYFKGQITKYVARWRKKNGVDDLEKALHFLEKLIELVSVPSDAGWVTRAWVRILCAMMPAVSRVPVPSTTDFIAANALSPDESSVIMLVMYGDHVESLTLARTMLKNMISKERYMLDDAEPRGVGYVDQDTVVRY